MYIPNFKFVVACVCLCMLHGYAASQTVPLVPAPRQPVLPNTAADNSNETWTIPDRNRINEGTVTVITAPAGGATSIFGSDLARVLDDDATIRVLPILGKGPVRNVVDILYRNCPGWDRERQFNLRARDGVSGCMRVARISHPCFLAVEMAARMSAKSSAAASERNPPEIFCRSFIMRTSRSAWLLVNGTSGSLRKRNTSSLRSLRRTRRLWPMRRRLRPRR